jgi:hypothetical protein
MSSARAMPLEGKLPLLQVPDGDQKVRRHRARPRLRDVEPRPLPKG